LALSTELNDLEIVERVAAGDVDAFRHLVRRHSNRIFHLAYGMLGNREDAEDVLQETFVRAYRGLRKFRGKSAVGTWLYSIAARLCLSRKNRVARYHVESLEELGMVVPAVHEDPVSRLIARESAERVHHALAKMATADRLLIVLKYIEGLSHEEIAGVLECSVGSSRARLVRAKRLFQELYERAG